MPASEPPSSPSAPPPFPARRSLMAKWGLNRRARLLHDVASSPVSPVLPVARRSFMAKTTATTTTMMTAVRGLQAQLRRGGGLVVSWLRANTFRPVWLPARWQHPVTGYLAAVLVEGFAILLTCLLSVDFPEFAFRSTLSLLGVVVIALSFGAGASLLATVTGGVLLWYAVLPPQGAWSINSIGAGFSVALVLSVGLTMSLLASCTERARRAAETARRAAETALQHRDVFLGIASHELRTPLTTIQVGTRLLARYLDRLATSAETADPYSTKATTATTAATEMASGLGPSRSPGPGPGVTDDLTARSQRLVVSIEESTRRMGRLVDQMLDASRIQAHRLPLHFARVDLAVVVRTAVEEQRQLQPNRTIRLDLPATPVLVDADADRIGQVVTNYLTNALKYTPADQPLAVILHLQHPRAAAAADVVDTKATMDGETDGEMDGETDAAGAAVAAVACVSVRDAGPGLPPEEQVRVWEQFHQAPDIKVAHGSGIGLGLGLYICRTIVQAHPGGQVGVQSAVGQGSRFWFTLPLPPAQGPRPEQH